MEFQFDLEFYKDILNQINSNIYITDIETDEIVYMNDYMKKTFHMEDAEGKICWKVFQEGMDHRCDFCKIEKLQKMKAGQPSVWREENSKTGRTFLNYDVLKQWNGQTYHIQNSMDITEKVRLSKKASMDELTGIYNRSAGKRHLEEMLTSLTEEENLIVALYDINGLKWVNDTFGHMEGDRLLVFTAQNIKEHLKKTDFVFRLSGDEFIVVFVNRSLDEVDRWMKDMLETLEEKRRAHGMDYEVTFSYGLAKIYAGDHMTVSDVLSIADSQMYIQKRDHHIMIGKRKLQEEMQKDEAGTLFQYNKDHLFEAITEGMDEYGFVGNLKTGEFMYSKKMVRDFGLPSQILKNAAAYWGEKVHPDDVMGFLRSNQDIAEGKAERHAIQYRARNGKNEWVHLLCKGRMLRDARGKPDIFAGSIRNLDETGKTYSLYSDQKTRSENRQDWNTDRKTGIQNYDSYMEFLGLIDEDFYVSMGVVALHIVDLKEYNYKYGRGEGDSLLIFVAQLLKKLFGEERSYRISGAGFLAICPNLSYEKLQEKHQELRRQIEVSYPMQAASSIAWEENVISLERLQEQAEEKMFLELNKKRKESKFFDDKTMNKMFAGIQKAIQDHNFSAYLQPKANARTGEICGAEALIRYYDQKNGIVAPARFLPMIEKAGLIRYMDLFILKDVCRMMRQWIDQGWEPFPISVNYSRVTILDTHILEATNEIVEEFSISKDLIEIEVTESIGSTDSGSLRKVVECFRREGYRMALDDFGAEYSNIYMLYTLDITSLKLDRRIVTDMFKDRRAKIVVENVIHACKKLGILCVAEGVETEENKDELCAMSCEVVQGYFLDRPLCEKDFFEKYISGGTDLSF